MRASLIISAIFSKYLSLRAEYMASRKRRFDAWRRSSMASYVKNSDATSGEAKISESTYGRIGIAVIGRS